MLVKNELSEGYISGLIGRVAELHATYYSENWGFGMTFEAKVASDFSQFMEDYNQQTDFTLSVLVVGVIEASISINGVVNNVAHLRWFVVSEKLRGNGVGNTLIQKAIKFCECTKFQGIYLWTFEGLGSARHLYEKYGFNLIEEKQGNQWGSFVTEQKFFKPLI